MKEEKSKEEKVKIQNIDTFDPVVSFVLINALKSVVSYVAVAAFKPVWKIFLKMGKKTEEVKTEETGKIK